MPRIHSPTASQQRMHQHRHNGLYGSAKMMQACLRSIRYGPSATDLARRLATEAEALIEEIANELYQHRRELDGSIVTINHKETE